MSLLILASFVFGIYTANLFAGMWTGIQNGVGNLIGIVASAVAEFIVERTGGFYFAFVWVCILLLVGAFSFLLINRKVPRGCIDQFSRR